MNLTEEQLRIINHSGSHARVSAVAGSGKTTTMVERIGHLLRQGNSPDRILVLMFNKSARDAFVETMQTRLASLDCRLPEVRTFHSLGMRLVKSFTKRGALPAYSLVTEEYVLEKLARQVANEVYRQEQEGWLAGEEIEDFLTFIDRVKSTTGEPEKVFDKMGLAGRYSYFIKAYELFEKARKHRRIRFYADLIHEPLMAMVADIELAGWVTNRVEHIIVDEYQDINDAQQQLLKILAGSLARVMVVGDVDQCIYEWRGALPEYITTRFQHDFPEPINYLLSYTFRYGHQLSLAANHLIAGNRKRDDKLCISHASTENTQLYCVAEKEKERGKHPILSALSEWASNGRSLREAVVLVRLFAQSVPVELALLQEGIDYRLEGNAQVFDCPEILALTGYLQLASGTLADLNRDRCEATVTAMLSQPHLGINREEMASLVRAVAADLATATDVIAAWCDPEKPEFIRKRFLEAVENWRWLSEAPASVPADKLLKQIVKRLKLYDFYHNFSTKAATAENRIKTCEAFIDFASVHTLTVTGLLEKIAEFRGSGQEPTSDTLLITSVHRAKGLEWPLVILPGLAEGAFPFFKDRHTYEEELEDERRLFYVAITRARERLVCIHPVDAGLTRCISKNYSRYPSDKMRASRFLYEANPGLSVCLGERIFSNNKDHSVTADNMTIASKYLQSIGADINLVEKKGEKNLKSEEHVNGKPLNISEIAEGLRVWHQVFGSGTVSAVKDRKQGRLSVLFDDHGEMILLAAYAKLQPL